MSLAASLWHQTVKIPRRDPLEKEMETEAVVIGAGMAGLLIAHRLRSEGMGVAVLEGRRIASGQTGGTTAKITSQHGMIYDALTKKLGAEKARQYAQANQQAVREYEALIKREDIDCDFERLPAYIYSQAAAQPMRREAEAARSLGLDAHFESQTGLPFAVAGAVRFDGQAQFHPLKFVRALSQGLEIYEDTPVLSVKGRTVYTAKGRVRAKHIVFATHYPFINLPGWYFMRMHQERSYVLALKSDYLPDAMYYGADMGGLSFRRAQGFTLLGGGDHRTGENSAGDRYQGLLNAAHSLLPGAKEVTRWSAQDCVTLDGVPYIGRYAPSEPDWYVATGFAKWGMSTSMVAAMVISALILGERSQWEEVFSPQRFSLSASAANLATETAQSFKGLGRQALELPRSALDALTKGHGGIVEVQGRKAGVYKDGDGRCHIVDPRCPHLGCQLEWNPDELSWDCPCHGSRFDYHGALIDNPAQEGLKK